MGLRWRGALCRQAHAWRLMLCKAEKHRHLCSICHGSHGLCTVSFSTLKAAQLQGIVFPLSCAVVLAGRLCSKLPAQLLRRSAGPLLCDD